MGSKLSIILCSILAIVLIIGCSEQKDTTKDNEEVKQEEEYVDGSQDYEDSSVIDSTKSDSSINEHQYSWTRGDDMPPVLIIIDDFGYADGSLLQEYLNLPEEIVFAILPDLPQTERTGQLAASKGHDVIIHIPMEAVSSTTSPGKRYIKTGMKAQEITEMIADFHNQLPMSIAANNHMGSKATTQEDLMTPVLDKLNDLGLFFIDSAVTANRLSYNLAKDMGYKSLRRDIFLDVPDNSDATIASKIEGLGRYKGRTEPIVIITHCHNRAKLEALQKFIAQIKAMGVELISLSSARRLA